MSSEHPLGEISWAECQNMPLGVKGSYFNGSDGRPLHALIAQQFDRKMLDQIGRLATEIRRIAKSKAGMGFLSGLLDHKRAMLHFSQPSTRTFLSFYAACQILGLKAAEVRDTTTSSEMKGESREDSMRTFSSYVDIIIMRTELQGFAERMAWLLSQTDRPVPIINAGSGKDQHPTQALLDIYTLQRSFEKIGGIVGKNIVFVGDLARGRTVRSLASLLTNYPDVKQYFVAPERLQVSDDIVQHLEDAEVLYEICSDFESVIPEADAIYMTRIQDEWDSSENESNSIDIFDFSFRAEHLDLLKLNAVIMHPLPRREEIETAVDNDPRAVYWRQVRNGMWIRVALMATIFRVDDQIHSYYNLNHR